jgi:hypothetical protein
VIGVIQCASRKQPEAGHLHTADGSRVVFVAQPDRAPAEPGTFYAHPDDLTESGLSWREELLKYNRTPEHNPLGLLPAWELYAHPTYRALAGHFQVPQLFVLSAGWGLIKGNFLTPYYDITFAAGAEAFKKRGKADKYGDFMMLPDDQDVVFFGAREYVPLFCALTKGLSAKRTVFYRAAREPEAAGCELRRYITEARTNWHYLCAKDFVAGKL